MRRVKVGVSQFHFLRFEKSALPTHLNVFKCLGFIEPHIFEFPVVFDRIRGDFLARINTWHDRFGGLFDPTALRRRGTSEGLSFT